MKYKTLRNLLALMVVMSALLPTFLLMAQNKYYGPGFSLMTTTAALLFFIAASIVQIFHNKKQGQSVTSPLICAGGFAFLMFYIHFFLFR